MASTPGARGWGARLAAAAGLLLAAGWAASLLVPAARELMIDMVFGFFLAVTVTALLVLASRQDDTAPRLWGLLAAGWAAGLAGNVAWGVYEMATGQSLPYVSAVDLFYLTRYVLVILAFASCLGPWNGRRWAGLGGIAAASVALTLLGLVLPAPRAPDVTSWVVALGAVLSILDGVILGLAAWSSRATPPGRLRVALVLLIAGMALYTAANWDQYRVRIVDLGSGSALATVLWVLSDVLAGTAAGVVLLRSKLNGSLT